MWREHWVWSIPDTARQGRRGPLTRPCLVDPPTCPPQSFGPLSFSLPPPPAENTLSPPAGLHRVPVQSPSPAGSGGLTDAAPLRQANVWPNGRGFKLFIAEEVRVHLQIITCWMTFRPVNNAGIGYFMITPCEEHLPREAGNRTLAEEVTREGGDAGMS
ncbi:hypothetical protein E2C01_019430 [Portunus trituberculatus]|uniref:Uncharacterized protein n=1 Tax=Portunus trituberculatus TaxID=210409 RepID=A0A5B7E0E3_PORTR|nr:hypothetical protein [Portunus trituberculatus]